MLLPVGLVLIAVLAVSRQWALSGSVTAASLAGVAFVPWFKMLLHRARDPDVSGGGRLQLSQRPFHTGHHHLRYAGPVRGAIPASKVSQYDLRQLATLIALSGLSRVHLQSHWPAMCWRGCRSAVLWSA